MNFNRDKITLLKTGSNSKIYRYGDSEDESALALKVVSVSHTKQCKHMHNEYKILKKLSHPNIVMTYKYKQKVKLLLSNGLLEEHAEQQLSNVLILECSSKGNLLEYFQANRKRLTIGHLRDIFRQICEAVLYLHENHIAHRDLKLQNILVFQQQGRVVVKLADFGFAESIHDGNDVKLFNNFKGTKRGYMAPQIHKSHGNPQSFYDARRADCFALGVILFSLVLAKLPFQYATKENKLYSLISEEKYQQFWNNHCRQLLILEGTEGSMTEEFQTLFQNLAMENPEQRLDVNSILASEWMKGASQSIKCANQTLV